MFLNVISKEWIYDGLYILMGNGIPSGLFCYHNRRASCGRQYGYMVENKNSL